MLGSHALQKHLTFVLPPLVARHAWCHAETPVPKATFLRMIPMPKDRTRPSACASVQGSVCGSGPGRSNPCANSSPSSPLLLLCEAWTLFSPLNRAVLHACLCQSSIVAALSHARRRVRVFPSSSVRCRVPSALSHVHSALSSTFTSRCDHSLGALSTKVEL